MARARKQPNAPRKGAAPARATKSTSRKTKSSASADVEVVEEAGGRFTDLSGGEVGLDTTTVLATNGVLHGTVREAIGFG